MSNEPTTLRAFVLQRMADLHMTQTELAVSSDLSISDINGIVQGRIKLPGAGKRRQLAAALKVSHLDLLVAAGEITQEELGTVAGIVQRNHDDPREQLIAEIRRTPMPDHYAVGLIRMLEAWQVDALRSTTRVSRPQSAE